MNLPKTQQQRISQIQHGRRPGTVGVVIHVMDGSLEGTLSWWRRRGNGVGAHVCIDNERAVQTADLDSVCWHSPGANHYWIGIEHAGSHRDTVAWIRRRRQRVLSANRCAWILYHYRCGYPRWGVNIRRHSSFRTSHKFCPGLGFPVFLYMAAVKRAYRNLQRSQGRTWSR